jgi:competence protein ComEC
MKKILQFIPVQLTVFLILGILFGDYFFIIPFHVLIGLFGLLIALRIALYRANMSFNKKGYFNVLAYILCFFLGISSMSIRKKIYDTSHYSHYVFDRTSSILIIKEVLKPSLYHTKYIAEVCNVNSTLVIGKVLLNVEKDSTARLNVDDRLFVKTKFENIKLPSNPYYFNYNAYMQNQQVYGQLFVKAPDILKLKTSLI